MRLRVATWNLENFDARNPVPLAERLAALRPTLVALDADVLCLQELGAERRDAQAPRTADQLDALLEGTPYAGFHRLAAGLPSGALTDVHNLAVLSRFPLASWRVVSNELVRPPAATLASAPGARDFPWDRPLLTAQVQLPDGEPLHLITAHLRAPLAASIEGQKSRGAWRSTAAWAEGFFLAGLKRTGQALEARLLVEACFDEDPEARVLVAGDLNADLGQTAVRILRARVEDTGNPALASRTLEPVGARVAPERCFSIVHEGRRQLVDHLLASPTLARAHVATTIANEGLLDDSTDVPPAGSFHAAVCAEFALGD
ncbi:MAG: endonuclease/exonuclease/phosphatase family protein [Myxococcota bacterium]